MKVDEQVKEKYSVSNKIVELNDDDDINMLGEDFEIEPEKDIDFVEEEM